MRLFINRYHAVCFIFFKLDYISFNIDTTNINFFKFRNLSNTMFWINNIIFNFVISFFSFLLLDFFYFRLYLICFWNSQIFYFSFNRCFWRFYIFFIFNYFRWNFFCFFNNYFFYFFRFNYFLFFILFLINVNCL